MSAQANFFKIGLFVIGATICLVFLLVMLGAGKLFQSKIVMETYFNESVQGLELGSKVKYRGVIVGEVRSIGFTYTRYQLDKPMAERLRYVMVEATILPRLLGGRAGAGDLTRPEPPGQKSRRGCACASRRRASPAPATSRSTMSTRRPIPSCPSRGNLTTSTSRARGRRSRSSSPRRRTSSSTCATSTSTRTIANLNKLLVNTNTRDRGHRHRATFAAHRPRAVEARDQARPVADGQARRGRRGAARRVAPEQPASQRDSRQSGAEDAARATPTRRCCRPGNSSRIPNLASSIAHMQRTLARLDRIIGGGESDLSATLENMRQISENLRDLTENAKRYPSGVILGEPPPPAKGGPMIAASPCLSAAMLRARRSPRCCSCCSRVRLLASRARQADVSAAGPAPDPGGRVAATRRPQGGHDCRRGAVSRQVDGLSRRRSEIRIGFLQRILCGALGDADRRRGGLACRRRASSRKCCPRRPMPTAISCSKDLSANCMATIATRRSPLRC